MSAPSTSTLNLALNRFDLFRKGTGVDQGFSAGADAGSTSTGLGGIYDLQVDSIGRWSGERWRGLVCQIERLKQTSSLRKLVISEVTSCFAPQVLLLSQSVGMLSMQGDEVGITSVDEHRTSQVGTIGVGRIKVFIDPYAGTGVSSTARDFICVGYRGSSPYDAEVYSAAAPRSVANGACGWKFENTWPTKIGLNVCYGEQPIRQRCGSTYTGCYSQQQYYRIFRVDNLRKRFQLVIIDLKELRSPSGPFLPSSHFFNF